MIDLRDAQDQTQIDHRTDFDITRYANCWEDSTLLLKALQPGPSKRILSIASAGDNSLTLLSTGAEVVAVDLSLPQLAHLELRAAAFRHLSYDDTLAFLGARPASAERLEIYKSLKESLSLESRLFWEQNKAALHGGLIHAGKFEDYFALFRTRVLPLVHSPAVIDALLSPRERLARYEFYDQSWNTRRWRLLFKLFFSRRVMGSLGRDTEFFRYVEGPVSREILRRAERALKELPTDTNPYLTYILRGNFEDALPDYLQEERFESIRQNLDKLSLYRGTVQEAAAHVVAGDKKGFDGFNLSDIFEYLDEETTSSVFVELLKASNQGARFAYWNMMVPRQGSALLPESLHHLQELSEKLHLEDRAFFYGRFLVDELRSPQGPPE